MSSQSNRRFDTFVIRLWRDLANNQWIRVDVEHVRGRSVTVHHWPRDVPPGEDAPAWLLQCLNQTTESQAPPDGERDD